MYDYVYDMDGKAFSVYGNAEDEESINTDIAIDVTVITGNYDEAADIAEEEADNWLHPDTADDPSWYRGHTYIEILEDAYDNADIEAELVDTKSW